MIYELHTYVANEGRVEDLHRRFAARTLDIFARLGIEVVAFFQDRDVPDRLVYLTRFPDEDARAAAWQAFARDPEWLQVKADSEVEGALLASKQAQVLEPTAYSPVP